MAHDAPIHGSVVYPIIGYATLLGWKKRKFCKGTWVGWGGMPERADADMLDTAIRELREETGISATRDRLAKIAEIECRHRRKDGSSGTCFLHAYSLKIGILELGQIIFPFESAEMETPTIWPIDALPKPLPAGDYHWLEFALSGKKVRGTISYGEDQNTLAGESMIEIVSGFEPEKLFAW